MNRSRRRSVSPETSMGVGGVCGLILGAIIGYNFGGPLGIIVGAISGILAGMGLGAAVALESTGIR